MNVVLFVTEENQDGIRAFVSSAAEHQKARVNGAFVVVHTDTLTNAKVSALTAPIVSSFAALGAIPVSLNQSMLDDGKISSMFGVFIMTGYSRFPGPWLVIDGYATSSTPDFLNEVEKQHRGTGSTASGIALEQPGSLIPIGPVVVGLPAKDLKTLVTGVSESWRSRVKYLFARIGFGHISPQDYLFSVSEKAKQTKSRQEDFDPSKLPELPPAEDMKTPVVPQVAPITQEQANLNANAEALAQDPPLQNVSPQAETKVSANYALIGHAQLYKLLWDRTGEKPHPNISSRTLVSRLEEIDTNASL